MKTPRTTPYTIPIPIFDFFFGSFSEFIRIFFHSLVMNKFWSNNSNQLGRDFTRGKILSQVLGCYVSIQGSESFQFGM